MRPNARGSHRTRCYGISGTRAYRARSGEHIDPAYTGGWLHCDIAGPADAGERGTGYGVALALALLEVDGFKA